MDMNLAGKVVLITGGASGIGLAAALAFAREQAEVVIADIGVGEADEAKRAIQQTGARAHWFRVDVSQADEVRTLVESIVADCGRIDCAFNNAGIDGNRDTVVDCTEENWDRVVDTNMKGVWLCMKYEIPQMVRQGGGVIVNNASFAGLVGLAVTPAYVASKHGVVGLTKSAALTYASSGIRVNAVCPGIVCTQMTEHVLAHHPERRDAWLSMEPIGRLATPEEIAKSVVWLSTDAASFVTGHAFAIDGGLTAR